MSDKIIFEESGITIETPAEPADVIELGDLIVQHRHAAGFSSNHLSDKNIRLLVKMTFYLSMRSDEGRFPCLRIISGVREDSQLAIKFSSPILFSDVHELRRLSPVAETPDFALLINESEDGALECSGLANVGHQGSQSLPGRPEIVSGGSGVPSLKLWIKGPGHLYIYGANTCFEYRAGRVRIVNSAIYILPRLRDFSEKLSKLLHQSAINSVSTISGADKYFGGASGVGSIINVMLRRLLDTTVDLRHGGAFVILPDADPNTENFDISCKFPLEHPDLGEDITKYWSTHIQASHSKTDSIAEYDSSLRSSYRSKARLLNNFDAVANLSTADGCVVLTKNLRVIGFGGSILVSEEDCKISGAKFVDEDCDVDTFLSNAGGQRHQSAARLVIRHNDVIVFVISQDGELSVFASDNDGYVRMYSPVDPSNTPT